MSEYYFTEDNVNELMRCQDDFKYFATRYLKIAGMNGIAPFKWNDGFDKVLEDLKNKKRHENLNLWRRTGKTTLGLSLKLHRSLFRNEQKLVSYWHNMAMAKTAESHFASMRSNLPDFIKAIDRSKIVKELRGMIGTENQILFTSRSTVRGMSINFLYVDEENYMTQSTREDLRNYYAPSLSSKGHYLSLST